MIIRGQNVGKKFDLDRELTVGRDAAADITLDDGLVSRAHARFTPSSVGHKVADLMSTNGTFVNDTRLKSHHYLSDGDKVAIGQTVFKFISQDNIEAAFHEHVWALTRICGLTGVHNRPAFDQAILNEVARSEQARAPLALMLFDLDHFKRINDTWGHRAGDYVLKQVGHLLNVHSREDDFAARYGGEEFAILIKGLPPPGAAKFAEFLRGRIAAHRFEFEGQHIPVPISAGVVDWSGQIGSAARLIELADQRMYAAKQGGRNQVIYT